MVKAYSWADVVLCRAGASTLAEIASAGLPVVLSPFPHAARDHQRHNARYVAEQGAGLMLEQRNFYGDGANPAVLADCLLGLIAARDALAAMARRSLELAQPYAAANVVDGLERLLMK
jgi:UDP-N-acetylglucosamine--N-acetylmuramyl-(pentapeptide) pyrophosphoryl-undecaprenol N-acetylglucosamine transferase